MEKMKVWLAYFDVAYEGYFEMEIFSKEEDAKAYLGERFNEYARWGDLVECVVEEMEVKLDLSRGAVNRLSAPQKGSVSTLGLQFQR